MFEAVSYYGRHRQGQYSIQNEIRDSIPLLEPVKVAATSPVLISSGVAAGPIDGEPLMLGDRVLLTAQTDPTQNGIWTVGNPIVQPLAANALVFVSSGIHSHGQLFVRIDESTAIMPVAGGGAATGGLASDNMMTYVSALDIDSAGGRATIENMELVVSPSVNAQMIVHSPTRLVNMSDESVLQFMLRIPPSLPAVGLSVEMTFWNPSTTMSVDVSVMCRFINPANPSAWIDLPGPGTCTVLAGTSALQSQMLTFTFPTVRCDVPVTQSMLGQDGVMRPALLQSTAGNMGTLPAVLPMQLSISIRDRSTTPPSLTLPSPIYIHGVRFVYST